MSSNAVGRSGRVLRGDCCTTLASIQNSLGIRLPPQLSSRSLAELVEEGAAEGLECHYFYDQSDCHIKDLGKLTPCLSFLMLGHILHGSFGVSELVSNILAWRLK